MGKRYRPKSKKILPTAEATVVVEKLGKDYYLADVPGHPDYKQVKHRPQRSERQKQEIQKSEAVCTFKDVMRVASEEHGDVRGHAIWQERYDRWVAKQKRSHNPGLINKETGRSLSNLWIFVRAAIHYMVKNNIADPEFPNRF